MQTLEKSVLKVLAYFDIFNHPVLLDEIKFFLDQQTNEAALLNAISKLEAQYSIYRFENYFTLKNDPSLIGKRRDGNKKAESLLPKAKRIAKLLYLFPFVRGVGISGSLSKNIADENSDFDYFIITKGNRLWITRSLMGLLKKISYAIGKPHWFCLNYYIDETCLKIPEHNIFTATELLTLLASDGKDTLNQFFYENNWVNNYFPVYNKKRFIPGNSSSETFIKRLLESLFNNSMGNKIDNWLMHRSVTRWENKKKKGSLTDLKGKQIELPLTSKNYCKQDPQFFQARVLNAYQERLIAFENILSDQQAILSYETK